MNFKKMNLGSWLNMIGNILTWCIFLVIFVGLPLFFKNGYISLSTNKYLYFMKASEIIAIVFGVYFVVRMSVWGFTKEEALAYKNIFWMDFFVGAFGLISLISHLFSDFRTNTMETNPLNNWFYEGSLWGTKGWFMGLMTYLSFVMLYFIVSRCLVFKKSVFVPALATAVIICIWGVLNRYCIAPINMDYDYEKGVFIASIGNINWLCGYTSVIVPILWGLFMGNVKKWEKAVLSFSIIVSFMMILCNSSDSGYFSLFVTMAVFFGWSMVEADKMKKFLQIMMMLFLDGVLIWILDQPFIPIQRSVELGFAEYILGIPSLIILVVVITLYFIVSAKEDKYPGELMVGLRKIYIIIAASLSGLLVLLIVINTLSGGALPIIGKSAIFTFNPMWGSKRGETWILGVKTFSHMNFGHKLIGSGPDTFFYGMIAFSDLYDEWNDFYHGARLTNAHNELITLLVNIGLLGVISFVGICVMAVKKSFEAAKEKPEYICFALVVISYFFNNMFSFQQITNIPFLFLVLGIEAAALVSDSKQAVLLTKKDKKNTMQKGKKSRKMAKK